MDIILIRMVGWVDGWSYSDYKAAQSQLGLQAATLSLGTTIKQAGLELNFYMTYKIHEWGPNVLMNTIMSIS